MTVPASAAVTTQVLPAVPRVEERLLSAAEVHTLRLRVPHRAQAPLLAEADEALAEDPAHVAALAVRAARDGWSALSLGRKAVAAHAEDPWAWLLLGNALRREEDATEREAALRKALALEPSMPGGRRELAGLLIGQGRFDEALPFARALVERAPWDQGSLLAEASARFGLAECPRALSLARRALERSSERTPEGQRQGIRDSLREMERRCGSPQALRAGQLQLRASRASARGDSGGATALLREALALDPSSRVLGAALGRALAVQGNPQEAVVVLRHQLEVAPGLPEASRFLGFALADQGLPAEAEAAFRAGLKATPDHPGLRVSLSQLLRDEGRPGESYDTLAPVLAQSPEDRWALSLRAGASLRLGNERAALADLRRSLELSGDPNTLNNCAWVLADAGFALPQAEAWAEASIESYGKVLLAGAASAPGTERENATLGLAIAWDTLGWLRLRQGRLEDAAQLIEASLALSSRAEVLEHLGEVREKQGRPAEEARAYAQALVLVGPPVGTRTHLRALVPPERTQASLDEARATLRGRRLLWTGAGSGEALELMLVVGADGVLREVVAQDGARPPLAKALVGTRLLQGLLTGSPSPLVLRAREACETGTCTVERTDSRLAKSVSWPEGAR